MATYIITGGSTGIGAATRARLQDLGHQTINLDIRDGDYLVDLSSP